MSEIAKGLAAPIIGLVSGKNALACLHFFKPVIIVLAGAKPQMGHLQNSIGSILHVRRQAVALKKKSC